MKKLYIFKTGDAFAEVLPLTGDFEQMVIRQAGIVSKAELACVEVIDALRSQALPNFEECAGVIITGSHAMVTDNLPWSLAIESWIRDSQAHTIPILGICYGHQLIAKALGGVVDFHPQGIEIGTVEVELSSENAQTDALFKELPAGKFSAHVTHSQSVRQLPQNAVHLAKNDFEANHAFRVGESIWGVQFHPEFKESVMNIYLDQQYTAIENSGQNFETLKQQVSATPFAQSILQAFVRRCLD